jgi:hypothetical protein
MTVTSRFFDERRPVAERRVPNPLPGPPLGRGPIGRLCFHGPSAKLDWTTSDLANAIGVASLPNAICFLDTNIFTKHLEMAVWDALCARRIFIVPGVWKELLPWLKTPFYNKSIRDSVIEAVKNQATRAGRVQGGPGFPNIEVLLDTDIHGYADHGYEYYLKLLTLRKVMGPLATAVLTKKLGRAPTQDEFVAEVQSKFGERGSLLARKGIVAANSPNRLTDEHLVISAVLTAILRGCEVLIVTRDPDVLEQYVKLLGLMKEHYRAMLIAEQYASNPATMKFREMPVENDGVHIPTFTGNSFLEFETTDVAFNPLPPRFHFVTVYCILLGGEPTRMKVTFCAFCAETEMARALKVKAATNGLSTDKLNGRNCLIRTAPLTNDSLRVIVSIGKEMTLPFGAMGRIGVDDFHNTLQCNELRVTLHYDDGDTGAL